MPQQREHSRSAFASATADPAADLAQLRACDGALSEAFNLLGKRWNGMILNALSPGPAGYSELRRALGTITDTRPPGVSYALTGAGAALLPVLEQLAQWASANLATPAVEC